MKDFCDLIRKATAFPGYDRVIKMADQLKDYYGVNHFWYYKITFDGFYSYFGTHQSWNECCLENELVKKAPNIRHPSLHTAGINFIAAGASSDSIDAMGIVWEKYRINFNLNITNNIPEGIESFGFATCFKEPWADQRLLNDLPLLRHFTKIFRERNANYFRLIDENAVDVAAKFGDLFYEPFKIPSTPTERDQFMLKLGLGEILSLSRREMDLLKLILNGYPAAYIAKELHLSKKTVENYLATLKDKLVCDSKVELIQKAKEIAATGYLD